MKWTGATVAAALATVAVANPLAVTPTKTTVEKRAETFCDQWGSLETGGYTIYNNLWGMDNADSGEQCTTVEGITDGSLAWSTEWSWTGGPYQVKSYANVVVDSTPTKLSGLTSMLSNWAWR